MLGVEMMQQDLTVSLHNPESMTSETRRAEIVRILVIAHFRHSISRQNPRNQLDDLDQNGAHVDTEKSIAREVA